MVSRLHGQGQGSPVIKSAQQIIGCPLTSLEDTANTRGLNRAKKILPDPSHPGNGLFSLLPSGKQYRVMGSRTNQIRSTFYPWAIRHPPPPTLWTIISVGHENMCNRLCGLVGLKYACVCVCVRVFAGACMDYICVDIYFFFFLFFLFLDLFNINTEDKLLNQFRCNTCDNDNKEF